MADIVKKVDIDESTMTVHCGTKVKESDPAPNQCEWTFDLESWTQDEILRLAARSLTIDAQRLFRKGEIAATADLDRDTFASTKKRGPSKSAAEKFLASLTAEERQAFLKESGLI